MWVFTVFQRMLGKRYQLPEARDKTEDTLFDPGARCFSGAQPMRGN
jgi:hypothetical protein